jgi:hypothetical protein
MADHPSGSPPPPQPPSASPPPPAPQPHHHGAPAASAVKKVGPGAFTGFIAYLLRGRRRPGEVTIVSHSNLFYWWPVWLCGFIMAAVTAFSQTHAGFMHGHPTTVQIAGKVTYDKWVDDIKEEDKARYPTENVQAIITDTTHNPFPFTRHGGDDKHTFPYMSASKTPGVIFTTILLVVIVVTNVPLRGLWSVIVVIVLILGSIIFQLAGWWEIILTRGRMLEAHLNMGAYLFLAITLFIVWLINFAFFDRQRYLIVTSGQVRLHLAVGEGEIVYDTTGMVFQKQRSDLFRHWMIGMGSGDLIIRPAGGKDPIDLPNVLFVGTKVGEIQMLIKEKEVVTT